LALFERDLGPVAWTSFKCDTLRHIERHFVCVLRIKWW